MSTQTYTNAVTLTDATEFNRFDVTAYPVLTGVAGTNTVTATGPANYSLSSAMPPIVLIPAVTNTGPTTLNITPSGASALTAKNVFSGGSALVGGELVAGVPAIIEYDGTQYNVVSGPAVTKGSTATTFTFDGTGGTSASITLTYQKHGQFAFVSVPAVTATTGTNSATLTSDTAIPAAFRPTTGTSIPVAIINNGAVVATSGSLSMLSTGRISVLRDATGANFTNSASAGTAANMTFCYFVG